MNERAQSLGEEIANSVSHGVSLLAAVAALPVLVVSCSGGTVASLVGAIVFGVTMLLLYTASTLYHALPAGRAKEIFNKLDHGAIYVFIAGSYTPFCLVTLRGPWGWSLFGVVWTLALLGIAQELRPSRGGRKLSLAIYIVMGWVALVALVPMLKALDTAGFAWVAAGGIFYTVGIVFYVLDTRLRHAHGVWHLFVMAGSAAHFFAIAFYVL